MGKKKTIADAPAITGIKAFDRDMRCRGFQFEIGKTYSIEGEIVACERGFHAVPDDQHPLSVLEYYPPTSRFCEVEQSGESVRQGNKLASASITVKAELQIHDLIARAIKWVFDRSKPEGDTATGRNGAASATGERGAASATGWNGAASATGENGAASATGWGGKATAGAKHGHASATGQRGAVRALLDDATLFAREFSDDGLTLLSIACGWVGRDGIKAGAWYRCVGGKLVEVSDVD